MNNPQHAFASLSSSQRQLPRDSSVTLTYAMFSNVPSGSWKIRPETIRDLAYQASVDHPFRRLRPFLNCIFLSGSDQLRDAVNDVVRNCPAPRAGVDMAVTEIGSARRRIGSEAAAVALFAPGFAGLGREALHVALLDDERGLIAQRVFHSAYRDALDFPVRAIVRDALTLDAAGMVIAHNHPSGDPSPSRADLVATRALVDLLRPLGIRVHDHLIFAADGTRSLFAMGLL